MQAIRKVSEDLKITRVLTAATRTADANSATVDMLGYSGVAFLVDLGDSGDTLSGSVKIELEIEESEDDSTWTDAANVDVLDYVTGTNTGCFAVVDAPTEDTTVIIGQYVGKKRYVRCVYNITGTHTNGTPVGVLAVRFGAKNLPVA